MSSYRWARHRVVDASGDDRKGLAPISTWWLAHAAAEETLQGSPLVAAWLKLFRAQLSGRDTFWLRWRGDFAESAELRRAYSGLYGRFFARSILYNYLGISFFQSLGRNGLKLKNSNVEIKRNSKGDIPDWIAWDGKNSNFAICEAKGSLTADDFISNRRPKCISSGKEQFRRVTTQDGPRVLHPAQWVAATRWATDERKGDPVTILWDPPLGDGKFSEDEADKYRKSIIISWLDSIAPGFGWKNSDDLLSSDREREAVTVKARPIFISEEENWPIAEVVSSVSPQIFDLQRRFYEFPIYESSNYNLIYEILANDLSQSPLYSDRSILIPREPETNTHENSYLSAIITNFGIRPIKTRSDLIFLKQCQDQARNLETPAMLVGIPINFDIESKERGVRWLNDAGIVTSDGICLFDLRFIEVDGANFAI